MEEQLSQQVAWQHKPLPFSNSQDGPQLPQNFKVGEAAGGGDCFFDSVAQGLKQRKPHMEFTVKSLRQICKYFAVNNEQVKGKVLQDARNPHDATTISAAEHVTDDRLWDVYLIGIGLDRDDVTNLEKDSPSLYQDLCSPHYGSTLQAPIWGRPEIEGQMICQKFKIKLHIIEKHCSENSHVWLNQMVDEKQSRSIEDVDYNDINIIHIINKGKQHFQPILRTGDNQQDIQGQSSTSEDDDSLSPEDELIAIIKSNEYEDKKVQSIERLFQRSPNVDVNFQDTNRDTPLHIAVRKREKEIIDILLKKGANINDKKNKRDRTPLDVARKSKAKDIVDLLEFYLKSGQEITGFEQFVRKERVVEKYFKETKPNGINLKRRRISPPTDVEECERGKKLHLQNSLEKNETKRTTDQIYPDRQGTFVNIPKTGSDVDSQPIPSARNRVVKWLGRQGWYTEEQIRTNPNLLFLFGDNDSAKYRIGRDNPNGAGQAEITRPKNAKPYDRLPKDGGFNGNAIGITTTFYDGYNPDIYNFRVLMDKEFLAIESWVVNGGCVVIPCQSSGKHSLGTGIANLDREYLEYIEHKVDGLINLGKTYAQYLATFDELKTNLHKSLSEERQSLRSLGGLEKYLSSDLPTAHQQLQQVKTTNGGNGLKEDDSKGSREKVKPEHNGLNESESREKRVRVSINAEDVEKYPASGLKLSLHGEVYQLKLLMLFLKRGISHKYSFSLATEMDAAEKFDDLVFKYENDTKDKIVYRFLQAKHKQDEEKKITRHDLLTEKDGEFSLQKYFISFRKITQNSEFCGKNTELKDFVICTNIDLHDDLHNSFTPIESEDEILGMDCNKKCKLLKLEIDKFTDKEELISVLKDTSDLNRLARLVVEYVSKGKRFDLRNQLFKSYHGVLAKYVIDVSNSKFRKNFLDRDLKDQNLDEFRNAFLEYFAKIKKQTNVDELLKEISSKSLELSKSFGKVFQASVDIQFSKSELENFVSAISNAIIKAENGIVNIKRESGKGKGVIKSNIDKLAGHVLVKKDETDEDLYYFNSKFFEKSIQMPGDLEKFKNQLLDNLENQGLVLDKDTYKFRIANFVTCAEEELNLKPTLPTGFVTDEEIERFFEKLVFAVYQPNEEELTQIIEDELGKEFNPIESQSVYSMFLKEMLDWMKEKQGRFYSHEEGKRFFEQAKENLTKLQLKSLALACKDFVEQLGIAFTKEAQKAVDIESFLTSVDKQILNLLCTSETILTSIKVYQALRDIIENRINDNYIFVRSNFLLGQRIKQQVLNAFKLNSYKLLVIECETPRVDIHPLYEELSEIIKCFPKKKIILICKHGSPFSHKFKRGYFTKNKYEEIVNKCKGLADLTVESQNKVLDKGIVIFQGVDVNLSSLVGNNAKELVDEDILSKIINNEKICVGKEAQGVGEIEYYYIDRIFNRQVVIEEEYLKLKYRKDMVAVSNIDSNEFARLVDGNKIHNFLINDPDSQNSMKLVLLDSRHDDQESFDQLCKKYNEYNIHWLRKENEQFVWIKSNGSLSELRNFVDTRYTNEKEANEIASISDRIVIVSAEPGMGKSTVLRKLAQETTKNDQILWIIRINLNDHTEKLEELSLKVDENEAISFLLDVACLNTTLEQNLFKNRINDQGMVALLFDGFDEIIPTYKEKTIELLMILKDTKIEKLWVTTRPHMRSEIEDKLSLLSYSLKPLSKDEQRKFLQRFWRKKLGLDTEKDDSRFDIYVDGILDVMSNSVSDKEGKFTGIPLQTRLLAEVFQDRFKEFYDSNEEKPNLPRKLNLVELYNMFVEKKCKIYCREKMGVDLTKPSVKREYRKIYADFALQHRLMALIVILSDSDVNILLSQEEKRKVEVLIHDLKEGEERTGIINQLINGRPIFIHRTFAEYFAASWFVSKQKECVQDNGNKVFDSKIEDLLVDKLFQNENEVLRNFFDRMLTEHDLHESKYVLHDAVLNNDKTQVQNLLSDPETIEKINSVDKGGRSPLHLAVSYCYWEIVDVLLDYNASIAIKDTIFGWSPLSYADKTNLWELAEILLENGGNGGEMFEAIKQIKEDGNVPAFSTTLLHIAVRRDLKEFTKMLVENGSVITREEPSGMNAFHIAAENGNLDLVSYFARKDPSILNTKCSLGQSPLHYAVYTNQLNVVKYIIENGGSVNDVDIYGKSALHYAVSSCKLDLVKYLVDNGADLYIIDNDGRFPFHLAAASANDNIIKYFLEETNFNVDFVSEDDFGFVHSACSTGKFDLVKYLVDQKGINVKTKDELGKTPLHWAAHHGRLDILKFLLNKKEVHVDIQTNSGMTPLLYAASSNNLDIVKYLIEEANSNCKLTDENGSTVVHFATSCRNIDLLKYLSNKKEVDIMFKDKRGRTALHYAALYGRLDIVKVLLNETKTFADILDNNGTTPLLYAASSGNLELVKYLVEEMDANVHLTDNDGKNVVNFAASSENLDSVKYFIDTKGISYNCRDSNGDIPLHSAAYNGSLNIVKYLLSKGGVDVSIQTNDGTTPLHLAASSGNLELVKYLLEEKGADINAKTNDESGVLNFAIEDLDIVRYLIFKGADVLGRNKDHTILHEAAATNEEEIIELILESIMDQSNDIELDINAKDSDGNTPLMWAIKNQGFLSVKMLLTYGADMEVENNDDETPLHWAVEQECRKIVELVLSIQTNINRRNRNGKTPLDLANEKLLQNPNNYEVKLIKDLLLKAEEEYNNFAFEEETTSSSSSSL